MEAIVLAGGFGTRLAHIISDVPKPMAPVCGRPFLRFILDDLQSKGIERVILAVGYLHDIIYNFFGNQYRGMEILYSLEDTPLFTGGAIKKALELCKEDRVLVVNGDTYFEADIQKMYAIEAPLVMAVKRLKNFSRYGTVLVEQGNITGFKEKQPCTEGLINGGIYLIRRNLLRNIAKTRFSFETEILEAYYKDISIVAIESEGYFIDIGIPEDYAIAQKTMRSYTGLNKAVFFDRDGTINVDVHYLYEPQKLQFIDGIPEFIHKWNEWGYKVIVVTNQAGIARGYYNETDMRSLHCYMNEQLKQYRAHIDAFYFCPHHPDFTGPCHCRKPEPGMIEQAIREFDLDPAQSILFGDKEWDLEAAKRCGIYGILCCNEK